MPFHFILYSRVNEDNVAENLGKPEYSYYFVYRRFKAAFAKLANITVIHNPESELTPLVEKLQNDGEDCYFVVFAPPQSSWVNVACPTLCVFAWEFDTLPDAEWDNNPMNNWHQVLEQQGATITLSSYSTAAVRKALGDNFKVATIPVPLPNRTYIQPNEQPGEKRLHLDGSIIDSNNYKIQNGKFVIENVHNAFQMAVWDKKLPLEMLFNNDNKSTAYLGGFYKPEAWGTWSKTTAPWILLPYVLEGEICVRLHALGHGNCTGEFAVSLGNQRQVITLTEHFSWHDLYFNAGPDDNILTFHHLRPNMCGTSGDPRLLGMGLKALEITNTMPSTPLGESNVLNVSLAGDNQHFSNGFHPGEPWGAWTSSNQAIVQLDRYVEGPCTLELDIIPFGDNAKRELLVSLGNETKLIQLSTEQQQSALQFNPSVRCSRFTLHAIRSRVYPEIGDEREIGIGVISASLFSTNNNTRLASELTNTTEQYLEFSAGNDPRPYLSGFHQAETWGCWSDTASPIILLPWRSNAAVSITLEMRAYGNNANRPLHFSLGGHEVELTLSEQLQWHTIDFPSGSNSQLLCIHNLTANHQDGQDPRSLGIGISQLRFTASNNNSSPTVNYNTLREVSLNGVVYTSVFNPEDGRKNWQDIVTAFTYAFRENNDAQLVLKITHQELSSFLGDLHFLLQHMQPYKCRIVALHGYLPDENYALLEQYTDFYVNASHCEGLCLPLLEFMNRGVPAVAPKHTAMNDFINSDNAFIVNSAIEPTVWPHDPRKLFQTHRYRIDWSSLRTAFVDSYETKKNQPEKYENMRLAAHNKVNEFSSMDTVTEQIAGFFKDSDA